MTNQNEIPTRMHHGYDNSMHTHRHGSHQHDEGRHSPLSIEHRDLPDDLRGPTAFCSEELPCGDGCDKFAGHVDRGDRQHVSDCSHADSRRFKDEEVA